MATMDVLAASNWTSVTAYEIDLFGHVPSPAVGWQGGSWVSEGKVQFNTCTVSAGKRIESIQFTYSASDDPGGWLGGGAVNPRLKVMTAGGATLFDASVLGVNTATLSAYDETLTDIASVALSAVNNWTVYMYNPNAGGTPDYHLTISALSFTYTPSAPPYLWQDYRNTIEIPS